jgi:hypothetical protein
MTGGMAPPSTSTETSGAMATATAMKKDTANTNRSATRQRC